MVPRSFPQPINLEALEQQNAALVHRNTVTLQSLEVTWANFEATQRQLMEIIGITRDIIRTPISFGDHWTKLSLECFRQHHPAKFTEKCLPDEVEMTQVLDECVAELEQHKEVLTDVSNGAVCFVVLIQQKL
ncbi:hypothetical protein LR48_Vigan02g044200 [Vigna angularis]|uniref:Uncharacterized protein n=2 Tax=Phaseolus angularis TaxID=3914 RepID=A0A0L9TV51_PHAAN|nr:hypothetical protein LR48_Vigan02g044200 [Vigna angularis]BAT96276.1 hypothetical protein VIGAN_08319000 [Vigna angularis var. angularis]